MTIVHALQEETLDALSYRHFGTSRPGLLEQLIELNPAYLPLATLPEHAAIQVPDQLVFATRATLRLWD